MTFNEGDLEINLEEQTVVGEYKLTIKMDYSNVNIELISSLSNPFAGSYSMIIENSGYADSQSMPTISIDMKTT